MHSRWPSLFLQRTFRCLAVVFVNAGLVAAPKAAAGNSGAAASQPDVTPPVYEFTVERAWLPMRDGVRLSVTLSKPTPRSPGETFPVLLDLLPYRKDEFPERHPSYFAYFPRRGYIMATVDIRGTGSSEGMVPPREYSEIEMEDAVACIQQLAQAAWSNGNVGMWGISWGGFNAIQVAMRRPPELKAILAMDATDDLYHDDVHFIDGAFHVDQYELSIDTDLGLPRWPDYFCDEAYFENRFNAYPWFLTYITQQKDGERDQTYPVSIHHDVKPPWSAWDERTAQRNEFVQL